MGRPGNIWDNAAMESFFSSPKAELPARSPSALFARLSTAGTEGDHAAGPPARSAATSAKQILHVVLSVKGHGQLRRASSEPCAGEKKVGILTSLI